MVDLGSKPSRRFEKFFSFRVHLNALDLGTCLTLVRWVLERKAQRENPAVVILMKFAYSNLHASAYGEAKSFRDLKRAHDKSGRQEDLFFPIQDAARPKRRILLKHGPTLSLKFVINRCIENDGPAENVRATDRKARAKRGLHIPVSETLGNGESG